jgi:hypothetical protein
MIPLLRQPFSSVAEFVRVVSPIRQVVFSMREVVVYVTRLSIVCFVHRLPDAIHPFEFAIYHQALFSPTKMGERPDAPLPHH